MPETSPIPEGYHKAVTNHIKGEAWWGEPGLKVIRLRLLSDPGHPSWDVSYCHGQLPNGTYVHVHLPFTTIPKGCSIKSFLVRQAKEEGIYARGLGILDNISTLI